MVPTPNKRSAADDAPPTHGLLSWARGNPVLAVAVVVGLGLVTVALIWFFSTRKSGPKVIHGMPQDLRPMPGPKKAGSGKPQ